MHAILHDLKMQGRNGKGSIYVYAAGNGGPMDNCNADGYVNSVYTIPITSVGADGKATWYAEVCAPVFAATYSGIFERNMVIRQLSGIGFRTMRLKSNLNFNLNHLVTGWV